MAQCRPSLAPFQPRHAATELYVAEWSIPVLNFGDYPIEQFVALLAEQVPDRYRHAIRYSRLILDGWNKQGIANEEVLRKGMEMIEGLYNGIR
jgi:hypothetical protein